MGGEFKNGIFGCMSNLEACCVTMCAPCLAVGGVAREVNESCCVCTLVSLYLPFCAVCYLRGKVRESKGIEVQFS